MRGRAYVMARADRLIVLSSGAGLAKKAPPSCGPGNASPMVKSKRDPSEK